MFVDYFTGIFAAKFGYTLIKRSLNLVAISFGSVITISSFSLNLSDMHSLDLFLLRTSSIN